MDIDEIERAVQAIRDRPLILLCVTRKGERRVMTIPECVESGAKYVHVVVDQLDELLGRELGGDADEIAENRRFPQIKGGEPYQTDKKRRKNHSGPAFKSDGSSGGSSLRRERKPDL